MLADEREEHYTLLSLPLYLAGECRRVVGAINSM
uniref:Uncharacterized protein n=1 Tax=uncultured Thiotrichaceae bacterium TaxID=298394 RepID=A0A6S6TZC4_9GAMM|nr:MAG: Unknown protein [uncultured Thiotrichaceae bacterium]